MGTAGFDKVGMTDRVIIVTGGTGGMGKATALLCAQRGAKVVIADLNEKAGAEIAAEIQASGGKAAFIRTDVTSEDEVVAMVDFAISTFGGLHGAFNNAGLETGIAPLHEYPLDKWEKGVAVNLTGVFLCVKHQLRHMLNNGGGSIVNTSSVSGVTGFPDMVEYVASKHGVVGITRAAAAEVSGKGIRVNVLVPGATETPMFLKLIDGNDDVRNFVAAKHPIGRVAKPSEMAEAAAWLLSDASSFVTGASINVDGGYSAL
ncbi:SDR family NAD(P)-dependent oxidoreductase [Sphingobium subterraneum]|uniref:2,5-dichloro-2,5-cyclohexadiene-1,4-diol dehydrogenase 1 n=1 Tax=Sphingobium subterraneum TaxID=627688 RepID=A0A841IVR9_9SPHN|nr:glucose 1-dehydrogenase [Sphingobium subterraneum]MBB6123009.1 2,5-dichloro-2,5-cyclohexadiene-1,4-diol dehydrogenase 1 [Sphingobium subterraneum]